MHIIVDSSTSFHRVYLTARWGMMRRSEVICPTIAYGENVEKKISLGWAP